jgi:hypothetical protein
MIISFSSWGRAARTFMVDRLGRLFTSLLTVSAMLMLFAGIECCQAQTTEPGQTVVCENIQKQINQLLEMSKSTSLTEEEKIAQLSKSWTDSLAAMTEYAGKDNENSKLVMELITPITAMMASALKSSSRDGKVLPEAKRDLDKVGELIRPYIGVMKMICPSLTLPESVPQ